MKTILKNEIKMRKKLLSAVLLLSIAVAATAQEKALKFNSFGDNWFLQIQAGGSYSFSEFHNESSLGDVISPNVALSIGKYFSPQAGARLQLGGWQTRHYLGKAIDDNYSANYGQASVDALLSLTNLFLGFNENRTFDLVGIMGIGYHYSFPKAKYDIERKSSAVPRVGLQANFRLSDAANFNIEATGNLLPDNSNGIVKGHKYDARVDLLAGVTFKFPQRFESVEIIDPSIVNNLNATINDQRASMQTKDDQIKKLQNDLARKEAEGPKVVTVENKTTEIKEETETLMNAVVVFKLGSAELQQNQDINIYNAARFLKDNPKMNVILTGYADKSTGTKEINQKISEKRADAVAKVLIEKHGIAASRITTKASGDTEQLFPTDEWNRVVTFTATSK